MRVKIILIIILFAYHFVDASNESDSTKIKYSLGVTPSAILNIAPAVQLSHDVSFSKIFSLGLETAYIFSHTNINNENTRGIRLRPQLKFTLFEKNNINIDLYTFYNYRFFKATRVRELIKAGGAYTEEVRGTRETTLKGFGLGVDVGFSEVDNFLQKINIGIGLGSGNINNEYSDQMFEPFNFFVFNQSGTNVIPILYLHLNMHIF